MVKPYVGVRREDGDAESGTVGGAHEMSRGSESRLIDRLEEMGEGVRKVEP